MVSILSVDDVHKSFQRRPEQSKKWVPRFSRSCSPFFRLCFLVVELCEELSASFGLGGNLATKANGSVFVAEGDGELLCVLIDSEVQHEYGSPRGK